MTRSTGFLERSDGTVMVRLFPGTDIHVEMAQVAARRLVQLLVRYNWTKSDPRLHSDRWRRFWRGIKHIERTIVVMFVRSNNGGRFRGTVKLDMLPQVLQPVAALRSRSRATDAVLREFLSLRHVFIRTCVDVGEIEFQWYGAHRDMMELCGSALISSIAEWLDSDGSIDLEDELYSQLLSVGLADEDAQQKASSLFWQVYQLIQDREDAIYNRTFDGEGDDFADVATNFSGKPTTRECIVQARSGQGTYRDDLLALWDNACAVTGCSLAPVLVASHAKPWVDSTDGERLDPNNGLPLVATLDRLFGAGLIGFDPITGGMFVASKVGAHDWRLFGIPTPLRRKPSAKQAVFLRYHLDHVFQWGGGGDEAKVYLDP